MAGIPADRPDGTGYVLENEALRVEIAGPGEYRRKRFDWSGFVTQVTAKATGTAYCTTEVRDGGLEDGGAGLCGEFGIFHAVGYDGAEPGDWFPKLGVGLLQKVDRREYEFFRDYPLEAFERSVEADGTSIVFVTEPKPCRGYAARLEKRLTVEGASLLIRYRLANTGRMPIRTQEYVHNFLNIGGHPIGPDYELDFSFPLRVTEMEREYTPGIVGLTAKGARWKDLPDRPFYYRFSGVDEGIPASGWELRHVPSGRGVREETDFGVSLAALWGVSHVVSPELFLDLNLEPGNEKEWRRRYTFF